jgi:hypothetical protein
MDARQARTGYTAIGASLALLIGCANSSQPSGPTTGSVSGSITSSLGFALGGVTVTATPSTGLALPATITNGDGTYTVPSVPSGSGTVSVSGLPAWCAPPYPYTYHVIGGEVATANIAASCAAPTGMVTGLLTSSLGGGVPNATVTVAPTGAAPQSSALTNANGFYSVSGVPVGGGTVAVSVIPINCTTPTPANYAGLRYNGVDTVNMVAQCVPPTGSISGVLHSSLGGGVRGALIRAVPDNGAAPGAVATGSSGSFLLNGVPVGGGSLVISQVPDSCYQPANIRYAGVPLGSVVVISATVTCAHWCPAFNNICPDLSSRGAPDGDGRAGEPSHRPAGRWTEYQHPPGEDPFPSFVAEVTTKPCKRPQRWRRC